MNKIFKCQLNGGLGNQILQTVILNWLKQKYNKSIIVSKFEYSLFKNKYRNIKGIESRNFVKWLQNNHIVNNDPMLIHGIASKIGRFVPYKIKNITDEIFLLGLSHGKDFFLRKLSEAKFMRAHCVFPQVINYFEFEEAWLSILDGFKKEDAKGKIFLQKANYDFTIHIRRGDYLNFPNLFYELKKEYFINAVDILKEKLKIYGKPRCLIIGNDINWAKENLHDSMKATYQYKSEFFDFRTLVNSKNLILSNSSFSIAAARLAMLNNAVENIICPSKYYIGENDIGPIRHKSWILSDNK